jgi:broad specificity phosphatase PhoE
MVDAVHLVRHGEVANPDHVVYADLPGFELSATGWVQARAAGEFLAGRPVVAIYSSPLTRAAQTAGEIAVPHGLEVETVDQVTEFGLSHRWRGFRWEELDQLFPGEIEAYLENPWDLPFSPESLEQMTHRMVEAVTGLAQTHNGGEMVVVSHQDPVQAARVELTERPREVFGVDKPGHAEVITLRPGAQWTEIARWLPPVESAPFPPPKNDPRP